MTTHAELSRLGRASLIERVMAGESRLAGYAHRVQALRRALIEVDDEFTQEALAADDKAAAEMSE